MMNIEKVADEIVQISKNEKKLSEDELCVLVLLHILGGMLTLDDEEDADKFLDELLKVTEEKILSQKEELPKKEEKKPERKKTELEEYLEFKQEKEKRLKERIAKAKKEWNSIFGNDADFF